MSSVMSFTDQSVHPSGWSTQELALFCRAARLLSSEGLCVETDYGLTDEGEPWLVLCDAECSAAEEASVNSSTGYIDQSACAIGWSAQEFALFFRAARLLSSEEVCIETDYGLTDEGEPWLVFCDADSGDVLGHFARMNDEYFACVPFRRRALRGWELSGLLSRFLRQRGIAWSTVTHRIIRNVDKLAVFGIAILQCA